MSLSKTTNARNSTKGKDLIGVTSGGRPFAGMRTTPLSGKGEQLVENMYLDTGKYKKMLGNALYKDLGAVGEVLHIFEYQKSDGTFQVLCIYKSGAIYLLRAIEEDLTITTPSGGAGDVNFTSATFDFVQIGGNGYMINKSATTDCYRWDGTTLTAITNVPNSPIFCTRDGTRLVLGYDAAPTGYNSTVIFSRADLSAGTVFDGGAGADTEGSYNTVLRAKDAIEGNTGVVIFGERVAEAHWVRTNNASDAVDGKTKIENFTYTGNGVSTSHRLAASKNFLYFVNTQGFFKMNPYSGETINLIEDSGTLGRYWGGIDLTSAKCVYSPKESAIVASLTDSSATNDRLFCYYEDNDAICFKTRVYSRGLGVADNQLYSGEDAGKVVSVFKSGTYLDQNSADTKAKIVTEWTAPVSAHIEKRFLKAGFLGSVHPDSRVDISYYANGYEDEIVSTTVTVEDVNNESSVIGELGKYEVGIGQPDFSDISSTSTRARIGTKFLSYAVGIEEESDEDLEVVSVYLDYLTYNKESVNTLMSRYLFPLSA